MKKFFTLVAFTSLLNAHFLTFLPSSDNVSSKKIELEAMFIHPFEQTGMTMEKPVGIYVNNKELKIEEIKKFEHKAWNTSYNIKKPGVYKFHVQPQAYFEADEEKYIVHVPKVIVSAYEREDGWDEPLGLKYEIIPMTKPFAMYKGNLFQGQVLKDGKAVANAEVEVEFFNDQGLKAPSSAHITQVVKADKNGVFSFTVNQKGWWGFAALIEEGQKEYKGKMYPIENGALLWIKAY